MLGSRIAVLRRSAKLSQAELAKILKISPSAVGMYEQGRREPALEVLVEMAKLFNVSLDFLVLGKVTCDQERSQINQLLMERVAASDLRLDERKTRPFSREELAVLFAAMLIEP